MTGSVTPAGEDGPLVLPEEEQRQATRDGVLLEHAERALASALDALRVLTPQGWERAWSLAMCRPNSEWHTGDVAMLSAARTLAMRADSPRFRPDRAYGKADG